MVYDYRNHFYVVLYPILPDEGRCVILRTWLERYRDKIPVAFWEAIRYDATHGALFKIEDVVVRRDALDGFWEMMNDYHEHFCKPSSEVPTYGYEYLRIGEAYDDTDYVTSPTKIGYLNVKRVAVLDPPWHKE